LQVKKYYKNLYLFTLIFFWEVICIAIVEEIVQKHMNLGRYCNAMIGWVYRLSHQSLTLMEQPVYETKGAIKHEFPLKNGTMYTHFWYFFSFFQGGFFCTTNILITYFLKKKNLYRTMMRCNPIILYWEKNNFSVKALRNFDTPDLYLYKEFRK